MCLFEFIKRKEWLSVSWSKLKAPNRKEVNPPINKHLTGSMTGAEELLKRESKPKSYKVLPTTIPLEQRVYAVTESERLVYASDSAYSKQRQLNAHRIIVDASQSIEVAKQTMRDYLAKEYADERVLSITLDKE